MIHILQDLKTYHAGAGASGILVGALVLLAACGTTEPRSATPVAIHLRSSASTSSASSPAAPLQLTSVRLVASTASLGSGDQFGCVDCQGNVEDVPATPRLVTVPNGGSIFLATEQAAPGLYSQAEISLEQPSATTLAGTSNWPAGATILIEGTYNTVPFQLPLSIVGSFRESLQPPLNVPASGASATTAITITLPIASWFQANGVPLNPAVPADRAVIEANARRNFQPLEAASPER